MAEKKAWVRSKVVDGVVYWRSATDDEIESANAKKTPVHLMHGEPPLSVFEKHAYSHVR